MHPNMVTLKEEIVYFELSGIVDILLFKGFSWSHFLSAYFYPGRLPATEYNSLFGIKTWDEPVEKGKSSRASTGSAHGTFSKDSDI
ncbi:MAG: hypothetical protein OXC48_11890 [Endozoicomonadaceae bacterium]|nr:hypothetical protein [Endozoicomonadaceae bacterium]